MRFIFPKELSIIGIRCVTGLMIGILAYAFYLYLQEPVAVNYIMGYNQISVTVFLVAYIGVVGLVSTCYMKTYIKIILVVGSILLLLLLRNIQVYVITELFKRSNTCADLAKQGGLVQQLVESQTEEFYQYSQSMFCTDECPCNVTNPQVVSLLTEMGKGQFISTQNGSINVFQCDSKEVKDTFFQTQETLDLAKGAMLYELFFNCSGFCTEQPIFYFSDINKGIPQGTCFDYWRKVLLDSYYGFIKLGFLIFFLVLIVILFQLCWFVRQSEDDSNGIKYTVEQAKQYLAQKDKKPVLSQKTDQPAQKKHKSKQKSEVQENKLEKTEEPPATQQPKAEENVNLTDKLKTE